MTTEFRSACVGLSLEEVLEAGDTSQGLLAEYPALATQSHGIFEAGPDFKLYACTLCGKSIAKDLPLDVVATINTLYYRALYDNEFVLPVNYKGTTVSTTFVLGGKWGYASDGPCRSPVMVIGKMPGKEELREKRNLVGPSGRLLQACVENSGTTDWDEWYISNIIRHDHLDPAGGGLQPAWIKNCLPLLQMELRLVKPKFVLLLGNEAIKAVLGSKATLATTRGRLLDQTIELADGSQHTFQVMTVVHPAYILRRPEAEIDLQTTINMFCTAIKGIPPEQVEKDIDHRIVRDLTTLTELADSIVADPTANIISVDCEWHGFFPSAKGAYLRTVQFSWLPKHAASVVVRGQGGVGEFIGGIPAMVEQLKRILKSTPERTVRIVGHFFNADMPWLESIGLDLLPEFMVPDDDPDPDGITNLFGWQKTSREGGFDTSLAAHAVTESSEFGLEVLAQRYTTCPRYDASLQEYKKQYLKEHKMKAKDLEGYGDIPDEILCPYGAYDVCATRRLMDVYNGVNGQPGLLDKDTLGLCSRIPFWNSMRASPAFGEMHSIGIAADLERAEELIIQYGQMRDKLVEKLRKDINWPEFNPASTFQVRELLFGENYNKYRQTKSKNVTRIRPEGAICLRVQPYKSTGKRPKLWDYVADRQEENLYTAATDKETLTILAEQACLLKEVADIIRLVRDHRFIAYLTRMLLREGTYVSEEEGEEGELEYERGMLSYVCLDGRIHSHFSGTKETGRASSWNPPLQNLAKSAEDKYVGIYRRYYDYTQLAYTHPVRSMLRARPGWLLVDADYTGAELAIMAWQSGDLTMIDHVRRANLKEIDPDYYDIHSNVAVACFKLTVPDTKITDPKRAAKLKVAVGTRVADYLRCKVGDPLPATKTALFAIEKDGLRTAAKRCMFGYAYGQQAEGMARKIGEEGVSITIAETQQIMDGLVRIYPGLLTCFAECREAVHDPGYIVTCFGRYRRFPFSSERQTIGEQERQAMNARIQSPVAEAMNQALHHLYWYRYEQEDPARTYNIVLQVHDSVVLEVPASCVDWVCNEALPTCLSERVPIWPCHIDGSLNKAGGGPYRLQMPPPDVFERWSVGLDKSDCQRLGIAERYAVR